MSVKEYTVKIYSNGDTFWTVNGKLHNEHGPAVVFANGDKEWHMNGKLHNEKAPAVMYANGDICWALDGKIYSGEEYIAELKSREDSFHSKIVEIDGKKYKLQLV